VLLPFSPRHGASRRYTATFDSLLSLMLQIYAVRYADAAMPPLMMPASYRALICCCFVKRCFEKDAHIAASDADTPHAACRCHTPTLR